MADRLRLLKRLARLSSLGQRNGEFQQSGIEKGDCAIVMHLTNKNVITRRFPDGKLSISSESIAEVLRRVGVAELAWGRVE